MGMGKMNMMPMMGFPSMNMRMNAPMGNNRMDMGGIMN